MIKQEARNIKRIFIHCSANDNSNYRIKDIRKHHIENNGWDDIGYHYVIAKDGTIEYGREECYIPASQEGHNQNTISICVCGLTGFTKQSMQALKELCLMLKEKYPNATFHGHCEVAKDGRPCPVFDYKKVLNLDNKGNMIIKTKQLNNNGMSIFNTITSFAPSIAKVLSNPVGAGIELLFDKLGVKTKEEAEEVIKNKPLAEIENIEKDFKEELELRKIDLEEKKIEYDYKGLNRKFENLEQKMHLNDLKDARKTFCENTFVVRGIMIFIYLCFLSVVSLSVLAYTVEAKGNANIIETVIMVIGTNLLTNTVQWFVGKSKQETTRN